MVNVRFCNVRLQATYDALVTKEANVLYFVQDTSRLYHGDLLIGTGALASESAAGLLSAEDYAALKSLIESGSIANDLQPVNGSIVVTKREDGKTTIGVGLSAVEGNILTIKEDGLFAEAVRPPEYSIEQQDTPEDGFAATYKLKKIEGDSISYVGDAINIPKDKVLQSATMKTVEVEGKPYAEAQVGNKYIDMVFNDEAQSHIYVPLGDIGNDVEVEVKIDAANANGLSYVDGSGLSLALASADRNGAMSKEMFVAVNGLLELDIANSYATKEDLQTVVSETIGVPNAEQFATENGVLTLNDVDADKVVYNGKKLSEILADMAMSYSWEELPETVSVEAENEAAEIQNVSDGAIVKITDGTLSETVTVNKSVTIEGANADVAQNFAQEV